MSTRQLFTAVAAEGGPDLDHSALVKAIEKMAGRVIGEEKAGR